MAAFYRDERVPLIEQVMARAGGQCEVKWDERCRGRAEGVHEILTRGRGGGIRGDGVNTMENCLAACHWCNEQVSLHSTEALARGLIRKGS